MPAFSARRISPTSLPFADFAARQSVYPWQDQPRWPCSWVRPSELPPPPCVVAYRLHFRLDDARRFAIHVSGDERYELFVDGERVGRGPSRAPYGRWHYESYELELASGEHTLAARVHSLGKLAPWAQTSYGHGWLLAPEPDELWGVLGTGRAAWQAKMLSGTRFSSPDAQMNGALGCGAVVEIDGATYEWDWLTSEVGWEPVETTYAGNNGVTLYFKAGEPLLHPTPLPPQKAEPHQKVRVREVWSGGNDQTFPLSIGEPCDAETANRWTEWVKGEAVTVGSHQRWRVLLDFEDYVTAFPALTTTGGQGAVVRLGWSEALGDEAERKGHRSLVEGRCWRGLKDTFWPDGGTGRRFEPLWWRCGRYLLLEVETKAQPLRLESLALEKTGYPLAVRAQWAGLLPDWEALFDLCQRSLEVCMHETYMDCPFYEQLQYLGDTRLQILLTYALSGDDHLARQALTAFAAAQRNPTGWMPSNHPSNSGQRIPPFPLWWVAMLHDFGRWRGDRAFVQSLLPTARQVVELWLENLGDNGLVAAPDGWNFVDWVDHLGDAGAGYHGVLNWHLAYTLRLLSELEAWCGEAELSARSHRYATTLARHCEGFWNAKRRLYADDLEQALFSQHANCLALLSGLLAPERQNHLEKSLFAQNQITRCSIYFSHYLFEAAALAGRPDIIEDQLKPWLDLSAQGFVTTPERFGESRSDCHAWGAHPLYHYFASLLGIRPASWGFESVKIRPQLGSLREARGQMPHPRGAIKIELYQHNGALQGFVTLPRGVSGILAGPTTHLPLHQGKQEIRIPESEN